MTVNREGVMAVRVISVLQLHIVALDNWGNCNNESKDAMVRLRLCCGYVVYCWRFLRLYRMKRPINQIGVSKRAVLVSSEINITTNKNAKKESTK